MNSILDQNDIKLPKIDLFPDDITPLGEDDAFSIPPSVDLGPIGKNKVSVEQEKPVEIEPSIFTPVDATLDTLSLLDFTPIDDGKRDLDKIDLAAPDMDKSLGEISTDIGLVFTPLENIEAEQQGVKKKVPTIKELNFGPSLQSLKVDPDVGLFFSSFFEGAASFLGTIPGFLAEGALLSSSSDNGVIFDSFGNPVSTNLPPVSSQQAEEFRLKINKMVRDTVAKPFKDSSEFFLKQTEPNFVTRDLPQALGSGAGFALATVATKGATTKLLGVSLDSRIIGTVLGAIAGRAEFEDEAIAFGADKNEARIARISGTLFGLTEALGFNRVFKRLDAQSKFSLLKNLGEGTIRKFLIGSRRVGLDAIVTGLENSAQEIFQQVGQNFTASDIAGYDPTRSPLDNVFTAGAAGGSSGFIISLLASATGIPIRRRAQAELEGILLNRGRDPAEASNILGAFVPIFAKDLELSASEITARQELEQSSQRTLSEGIDFTASALGDPVADVVNNFQANDFTNSSLINNIREHVNMSLADTLETPKGPLKTISNLLQEQDVVLEGFSAIPSLHTALKTEAAERNIKISDAQLALMNNVDNSIKTIATESKKLVEVLRSRFLPNKKVILSTGRILNSVGKGVTLGDSLSKGFSFDDNIVIALNIPSIVGNGVISDDTEIKTKLFTAIGLEFGHQIIDEQFTGLNRDIQKALAAEFIRFREDTANSTISEFLNSIDGIQDLSAAEVKASLKNTLLNSQTATSFNEFAARKIADEIAGRGSTDPITTRFFKKSVEQLKELYRQAESTLEETKVDKSSNTLLKFVKKEFPDVLDDSLSIDGDSLSFTIVDGSERGSLFSILPRVQNGNLFFDVSVLVKSNPQSEPRSVFVTTVNDLGQARDIALGVSDELSTTGLVSDNLSEIANTVISRVLSKAPTRPIRVPEDSSKLPTFSSFTNFLSVRGQVQEHVRNVLSKREVLNRFSDLRKKLIPAGFKSDLFDQAHLAELDKWNKAISLGFDILDLRDVNPHIPQLSQYVDLTTAWNASKIDVAERSDAINRRWRKLGKEQANRVANVLLQQQLREREFTPDELDIFGINADGAVLMQDVTQFMRNMLERMRNVIIEDLRKTVGGDITLFEQRVEEINREFKALSDKPFFPLMRFGPFGVVVRAQSELVHRGKRFKAGQVVSFETFDTRAQQKRGTKQNLAEFNADKLDVGVSEVFIDDTTFALQALPPSLLNRVIQDLNLTKEQQDNLNVLLANLSPSASFRKHFLRRKKIFGFSSDAQRGFNAYAQSAASHLARIEFAKDLQEQINEIRQTAKEIGSLPNTNNRKRVGIARDLQDHLNYILNPGNEWAGVRSAGFFVFLGFLVKSAAVNLVSVPMVTFPLLSAKFGEINTTRELTRALRDTFSYYLSDNALANEPELLRGMALALKENKIDQSFATSIAAAAEDNNIDRLTSLSDVRAFLRNFAKVSALPFHVVEKFSRTLTFIAAFRLAQQAGMNEKLAYITARDVIDSTLFEYARFARPRFLRGPQSALLLFVNFIRKMLIRLFSGNPGVGRTWVILLSLAGLEGLPFFQNLEDVADFLGTKLKELLGLKNPKVQTRVMLREALNDLKANPDLFLHGASRFSFGTPIITQLTGIPLPVVDLSGAIGLGRILPTDFLNRSGTDFDDDLISALEGSGAVQSFVLQFLRAVSDNDPDNFKRFEQLTFKAAANIAKAARFAREGRERTRSGETIATFDLEDPVDNMNILAQAFGFTPEKVSAGWEKFVQKKTASNYYLGRRALLLDFWGHADQIRDREMLADVNKNIAKFNFQVPFPELRISSKDKSRARKRRRTDKIKAERGLPDVRIVRRVEKQIEDIFTASEETEGISNGR